MQVVTPIGNSFCCCRL